MSTKVEPLTPYEAALYEALLASPDGISYEHLQSIKVPVRTLPPQSINNRFATHMRSLRRKLGIRISNVRDIGYRLEK